MAKQTSLDALNNHLFETIEMLKNNSDPKASDNEKIDLETAKQIGTLGKVIVDGYKVKAQVLNMITRDGIEDVKQLLITSGINNPEEKI